MFYLCWLKCGAAKEEVTRLKRKCQELETRINASEQVCDQIFYVLRAQLDESAQLTQMQTQGLLQLTDMVRWIQ